MSVDMTPANIYRHLGCEQDFQGTLCEDEAEELDNEKDKMRIYKAGYTTGTRVPRNDKEGLGSLEQKAYCTFCFKAFAAEHSPDSTKAKGFNTRTIPMNCISGVPTYDLTEVLNATNEDDFIGLMNRLYELRNLLFCFKLIHSRDKFPNITLNIEHREKQLFKPLLRLFQGTKTQEKLLEVVSHFVNERRVTNNDTLISILYSIICNLVDSEGTKLTCKKIWDSVKGGIEGSEIPYKPRSYETSEFGTISQQSILQLCRDNFNAKPPGSHGNERSLEFNKEVLDQLESKYTIKPIKVGTCGTCGTSLHEKEENNKTGPGTGTDGYSSSSFKNNNNMSHMSQKVEFEHDFDPSKVGHVETNASQDVLNSDKTSQDISQKEQEKRQDVLNNTKTSQDVPFEESEHAKRVNDRYSA